MMDRLEYELPDTDNPQVMTQAVAVYIMSIAWPELARAMNPDETDKNALEVYDRIYRSVAKTHGIA